MTERLTTLAAVKEWLDITTDGADDSLIRIIDAASQFVLGWLNRDSFQAQSYTQNFRGNGKSSMLLRNWPIISITSVGIGGASIPAASAPVNGLPGSGYMVSDPRNAPQSLELFGYAYVIGSPSQVVYTAGFRTSQSSIIPAVASGETYAVLTPNTDGCWSADLGVTIDGVAATLSAAGTPTAGQYAVDEWGTYSFNSADVGKTAVMSYDYTPWAVSFAVTELIGEWYKRKDRIGVLSKTLGGQETVTFSQKDMNDSIRGSLQLYNNVVPI